MITATASGASAQSLAAFKDRLSLLDSVYTSRVTVTEHGPAASAVRSIDASTAIRDKVHGYRVVIFSDNSQNAREGAMDAQKRFEEACPDIPTYLEYDIPTFKVAVGNCLTREEAIILQNRIIGLFPTAFFTNKEIPLSLFGEKIEIPLPEGEGGSEDEDAAAGDGE